MLKTFFGCCPLRNAVSVIALTNLLFNIGETFKHGFHRYEDFHKTTVAGKNHNGLNETNDTTTEYYPDYWSEVDEIPVMSGMFMDYIFIINVSWIILELMSNTFLKQSTFKHAPQKIYAWLTVYYANFVFMFCHVLYFVMKSTIFKTSYIKYDRHYIEQLIPKLVYTVLIGFQVIVVQSYYILEKKAVISDFVQLKWKYVSKGKVVSDGVDYPSTSTFKAETLSQTEDGSRKTPPYITSVLQN